MRRRFAYPKFFGCFPDGGFGFYYVLPDLYCTLFDIILQNKNSHNSLYSICLICENQHCKGYGSFLGKYHNKNSMDILRKIMPILY